MRVALLFDKGRADTVGIYFEQAARALGLDVTHAWLRDADRLSDDYDLYLRIDHGEYTHDVPDRLRPKVFYAIDTHVPSAWRSICRQARRYDLVCCAQRAAAHRLPRGGWVPVACDPVLQSRPAPCAKQWDVAFVGTEGGVPRKFYLQALRERYRKRCVVGQAPHTQLGAIYGAATIGFNYSIRQDVNMRMFEIWASGSLLMTNRLPHDDLAQLGFRDGEHYVSYRAPKELFERVDYYLSHDEARERIATAGMLLVRQAHTYRHRLQHMLDLAVSRKLVTMTTTSVS